MIEEPGEVSDAEMEEARRLELAVKSQEGILAAVREAKEWKPRAQQAELDLQRAQARIEGLELLLKESHEVEQVFKDMTEEFQAELWTIDERDRRLKAWLLKIVNLLTGGG